MDRCLRPLPNIPLPRLVELAAERLVLDPGRIRGQAGEPYGTLRGALALWAFSMGTPLADIAREFGYQHPAQARLLVDFTRRAWARAGLLDADGLPKGLRR